MNLCSKGKPPQTLSINHNFYIVAKPWCNLIVDVRKEQVSIYTVQYILIFLIFLLFSSQFWILKCIIPFYEDRFGQSQFFVLRLLLLLSYTIGDSKIIQELHVNGYIFFFIIITFLTQTKQCCQLSGQLLLIHSHSRSTVIQEHFLLQPAHGYTWGRGRL